MALKLGHLRHHNTNKAQPYLRRVTQGALTTLTVASFHGRMIEQVAWNESSFFCWRIFNKTHINITTIYNQY